MAPASGGYLKAQLHSRLVAAAGMQVLAKSLGGGAGLTEPERVLNGELATASTT
jgi:hypothetical protein